MVKCSLKELSVETELGLLMTFLFIFKVLLSFVTNVKIFIWEKQKFVIAQRKKSQHATTQRQQLY